MTTIKATCPTCGDVDLTPAQLRLVVASKPGLSYYSFSCGRCRDVVRRPAAEDVVKMLVSGGVTPEPWDVPAEALETHDGPALGYDDLLDFALALSRVDRLVGALAPTTGATV
jgi:hypothetical protein